MKTIGVTVEVARRRFIEVELPDDVYGAFVRGEIGEYEIPQLDLDKLIRDCRTSNAAYEEADYAITDEYGNDIISWR